MQSDLNHRMHSPSTSGLKQVKVDNWGSFFLQRLLHLYFEKELLDLTIKFPTSDITVKIHRLVATTCTDYFSELERQQKERNSNFNGTIVMPPDMPYECVKAIISFMYTGQLEYWMSEQKALYRTAEKMKMTVLTKLLDTQFETNPVQVSAKSNVQAIVASPDKRSNKKSINSLPTQTLPGRKLPIWKRKLDDHTSSSVTNYNMGYSQNTSINFRKSQITEGPSRFDLPEADDMSLGVFSAFDDITYHTKPIVQAPEKAFAINATSGNDSYSSYNEKSDKGYKLIDKEHGMNDDSSEEEDDWVGLKSILKQQEKHATPPKKVRFDVDEKENVNKSKNIAILESADNHTKIIKEVLKKYPHLVKNNKNIRLKIMQKESKSPEHRNSNKTTVSYMVLNSDHLKDNLLAENSKSDTNLSREPPPGENGPWKCYKCHLSGEYTNYYLYRRHMQDVHDERFDPRICEHCGFRATKRNFLMYHMYMKHNVPPPKNMSFPKCHACSYVALSESLLVRHQINHNHRPPLNKTEKLFAEELRCARCSQVFASADDLTNHEASTGHALGNDKRHRCPYCGKRFVRWANIRVHIESCHKNELMEVNNYTAAEAEPTEFTHDEPVPAPLEPSSEAKSLETVASGIAASLGIEETIPSDQQNQETLLQTHEFAMPQDANLYNGEIDGQQMIMLIDGDDYQQQIFGDKNQHIHQLNVPYDGQLLMQGTEDGVIVYIQNSEIPSVSNIETVENTYEMVPDVNNHEPEQIVEEVVEEVEEYYEHQDSSQEDEDNQETYENVERSEGKYQNGQENVEDSQSSLPDDGSVVEQVEEVIQYIEETEIVEYHEEPSDEEVDSRNVDTRMDVGD